MNTDDTPEYRIYGVDAGTWDGKKINRFDLVHISVAVFNNGSYVSGRTNETFYTQKPGEHTSLYIPEYSLTNNGYGPAYFFKGVIDYGINNNALIGNTATYFSLDGWNYLAATTSRYQGIICTSSDPSSDTSSKNKSWQVQNGDTDADMDVRREQVKKWCCEGISDAYQQRINSIDSEITLIEFLDSGDVSLDFMRILNGYGEEGATSPYHGYTVSEKCTTLGQTNAVAQFVYITHTGSRQEVVNLKTCTDKSWVNWIKTVSAGDKIIFKCKADPKIQGKWPDGASSWSNNLNYAIIFFTNQIAGWKKAD